MQDKRLMRSLSLRRKRHSYQERRYSTLPRMTTLSGSDEPPPPTSIDSESESGKVDMKVTVFEAETYGQCLDKDTERLPNDDRSCQSSPRLESGQWSRRSCRASTTSVPDESFWCSQKQAATVERRGEDASIEEANKAGASDAKKSILDLLVYNKMKGEFLKCATMVTSGQWPCPREDSIQLTWLRVRAFSDSSAPSLPTSSQLRQMLAKLLPPMWRSDKGAIKRATKLFLENSGITSTAAMERYLDVCRCLHTFNTTSIFHTKDISQRSGKHGPACLLAITTTHYVKVEPKTSEAIEMWPLHLHTMHTADTFSIFIARQRHVCFFTSAGSVITETARRALDLMKRKEGIPTRQPVANQEDIAPYLTVRHRKVTSSTCPTNLSSPVSFPCPPDVWIENFLHNTDDVVWEGDEEEKDPASDKTARADVSSELRTRHSHELAMIAMSAERSKSLRRGRAMSAMEPPTFSMGKEQCHLPGKLREETARTVDGVSALLCSQLTMEESLMDRPVLEEPIGCEGEGICTTVKLRSKTHF